MSVGNSIPVSRENEGSLSDDARHHGEEIEAFAEEIGSEVDFRALTYQELFSSALRDLGTEHHHISSKTTSSLPNDLPLWLVLPFDAQLLFPCHTPSSSCGPPQYA
jgi:hypothetical protein